jgi:hypothetical protein
VTAAWLLWLVLLDVPPPPSPTPAAHPGVFHGLPAYLIGGFFGLGMILLTMLVLRRRPSPPR